MKVLIIQRIFSHYRKPVFDKLAAAYDLTLIHSNNKSGIKQAQSPYSRQVKSWQYGKGETNQLLWLFAELLKFKPKVVIHEMAIGMPTMFFVLWLHKIFGYQYILWGHGYDRKSGFDPSGSLGDRLRLYVMKKAGAVLLYDSKTKEFLSGFLPEKKLFVASNTLDTEKLLSIRKQLKKTGRSTIRKQLNWSKKYNLIYIGRLLASKHPEKLFDILNLLQITHQLDVALHIIGSGPEENKLKTQVTTLLNFREHVFFYGAIHDEFETGKMLYAADLMIIPGAVGLSVNHAFAFECPVATFEKAENGPHHGPEITYILPETGIIAPAFNYELMAQTIADYLHHPEQQNWMRKNAADMLESSASISNMLAGFKSAITHVSNQL
jgi:glycosyltransferase involved in cell wall biosynthesis